MSWARTGSAGTFEIRAPSGDRGRVEASAAGRTRALYRWQRDENPPVTLLLEPAAPISGQVVDEAGKPVPARPDLERGAGARAIVEAGLDLEGPRLQVSCGTVHVDLVLRRPSP